MDAFVHGFAVKELCVQLNLTNTHWNMIFIYVKDGTCFRINPYHHTNPTDRDEKLGFRLATSITDTVGL